MGHIAECIFNHEWVTCVMFSPYFYIKKINFKPEIMFPSSFRTLLTPTK